MCIICNMGPDVDKAMVAGAFLSAWDESGVAMRQAAHMMHIVSKTAPAATDRKRYDKMHKRMVKAIRDWNRLEMEREAS